MDTDFDPLALPSGPNAIRVTGREDCHVRGATVPHAALVAHLQDVLRVPTDDPLTVYWYVDETPDAAARALIDALRAAGYRRIESMKLGRIRAPDASGHPGG